MINIQAEIKKHTSKIFAVKNIISYTKLSIKEQNKLRFAEYYKILKKMDKEVASIRRMHTEGSRNKDRHIFIHFVNIFEYLEILDSAYKYVWLYDWQKEKVELESHTNCYRYENVLRYILEYIGKNKLADCVQTAVVLNLTSNTSFEFTDDFLSLMERLYSTARRRIDYEYNTRVNI